MSLKGIDISSWQGNINLTEVPADFVICKATQGIHLIDSKYDRNCKQAKKKGRLIGLYHYAEGGDPAEEADFFLNVVKKYVGKAILVVDWESQDNPRFGKNDKEWCEKFCDYIYKETGVKPLVYVQASAMNRLKGIDYGLWVAQYPDYEKTGYQDHPWNEGAYDCVIRQYTSSGRLSGYNGNLDLNKFYGSRADWKKHAAKANILKADGVWGKKTTKRTQEFFGTEGDGIVSNQLKKYEKNLPHANTKSWKFCKKGVGGSAVIKKMKVFLNKYSKYKNIKVTGYAGPEFVKSLQTYAKQHGFYDGPVDGTLGPNTVKGWQKYLNNRAK